MKNLVHIVHHWELRSDSSPARAGFTIVELLVAITIIALLMSLLVPALGNARDQTRLTLCRTRLRNVGIAALLYANANKSFLPVDKTVDNPHGELITALGKGRYVNDPQTYYCPSMTRPDLCFSEENVAAGQISYFYYSCREASTDHRISTFLRWEVAWPRELRDAMDPQTWVISDAWFSGEPTAHRFYKKGVNYFTLGGSVEMIERSPRREFK